MSSALARATRSVPQCRMMGTYKTSTGLVGLAVDPNGRETLLDLAASIKEAVKVGLLTFLQNISLRNNEIISKVSRT